MVGQAKDRGPLHQATLPNQDSSSRFPRSHLSDDTGDGLDHSEALSSDRVNRKSAGSSLNVGRLSAPTPQSPINPNCHHAAGISKMVPAATIPRAGRRRSNGW